MTRVVSVHVARGRRNIHSADGWTTESGQALSTSSTVSGGGSLSVRRIHLQEVIGMIRAGELELEGILEQIRCALVLTQSADKFRLSAEGISQVVLGVVV